VLLTVLRNSFLYGSALTPEIDFDQTAMGLPPVKSAVFLIASDIAKMWVSRRNIWDDPYGDKVWGVCMYFCIPHTTRDNIIKNILSNKWLWTRYKIDQPNSHSSTLQTYHWHFIPEGVERQVFFRDAHATFYQKDSYEVYCSRRHQ
jgi:hypothetical protein